MQKKTYLCNRLHFNPVCDIADNGILKTLCAGNWNLDRIWAEN